MSVASSAMRSGSAPETTSMSRRGQAAKFMQIPEPPHPYEFERGNIKIRMADESLLQDQTMNESHGCDRMAFKCPIACLSCLVPIPGWCWLISKTNLVRQNEVAVVTHVDGQVSILNPGLHLSGCMTSVRKFQLMQDRISHGNMHIIRIYPGQYGVATRNGIPEFLSPGRHVIKDPLFQFERTESMSTFHIKNGTSNIITVGTDQVGLVMVYGVGHILEAGIHYIDNPALKFEGFKQRTKEYISVGQRHRILVPSGKIGLAWNKGEPMVIEHGKVLDIVSGYFKYVSSVSLQQDIINHGSLKFIMVKEGVFGISNDEGVLHILNPGRHVLRKPTHSFQGFLPSGQITLSIEAVTSMSADNVGIKFDSALTIQVVDAKKAVSVLGMSEPLRSSSRRETSPSSGNSFSLSSFYANVIAKAKLSLSILIGNNRINQSFKATSTSSKTKMIVAEVVGESSPPNDDPEVSEDNSSFKQHIHDIFMHSFSEDMLERCGVDVIDMSIEDIVITNEDLARAMARGAVAATDLDKARIELEVNQTKARSERAARITRAQGEAEAMSIIAEAEASRIKKLDAAMKGVSDVTRQRELINSAGNVIGNSKSTLLLGADIQAVSRVLGGGGGGGLVADAMR